MEEIALVPRRLVVAVSLVIFIVVIGVLGYMWIEHWTWFEALYMTVTALTTLGGGEAHPLSNTGRAFTLVVVVVGVGAMTYTVLLLVSFVLEGQLNAAFGVRRLRHKVGRLENHFVLCGYGRVGREIAKELAAEKVPFVIIDRSEQSLRHAIDLGYLVVSGDAAAVETLNAAGLERARGLITALDGDAANIYVTLSARVLRPNLFIVARVSDPEAEPKLRLAGADRIISPYTIGGRRMANLAMRPTAVDFVDNILSVGNADLVLEALTVREGSAWAGKFLGHLFEGADMNETTVLAIKRGDRMLYRPGVQTALTDR